MQNFTHSSFTKLFPWLQLLWSESDCLPKWLQFTWAVSDCLPERRSTVPAGSPGSKWLVSRSPPVSLCKYYTPVLPPVLVAVQPTIKVIYPDTKVLYTDTKVLYIYVYYTFMLITWFWLVEKTWIKYIVILLCKILGIWLAEKHLAKNTVTQRVHKSHPSSNNLWQQLTMHDNG
jgi:hypothetical protein